MILRIYTIYDKIAQEGAPPFFAKNDKVAQRQYRLALQDAADMSEYGLYYLGDYDTEKMSLKCEENPFGNEIFLSSEVSYGKE